MCRPDAAPSIDSPQDLVDQQIHRSREPAGVGLRAFQLRIGDTLQVRRQGTAIGQQGRQQGRLLAELFLVLGQGGHQSHLHFALVVERDVGELVVEERVLEPLDGLLGMMPGFNKIKKQLPAGALDTGKIKRTEAIVLSMTHEERRRPEIIKGSRRQRIAAGSGTSLMEVNQLIKQFGEMRKMMKSPHKMKNMMRQMGGMPGMKDMMKGLGGKLPF